MILLNEKGVNVVAWSLGSSQIPEELPTLCVGVSNLPQDPPPIPFDTHAGEGTLVGVWAMVAHLSVVAAAGKDFAAAGEDERGLMKGLHGEGKASKERHLVGAKEIKNQHSSCWDPCRLAS
eukprot:1157410-Pelagomonas_calceolata.AAC.11